MVDVTRKTAPSKIIGDTVGTMERVLSEVTADPNARKPSVFKMHAPILDQGSDRTFMAATDRMWVFVNTYGPKDGENRLHTHVNEDHTFIVLQGQARFTGPRGETHDLQRNEGIMLPRGTLYTFRAVDGPLVLLRVGCVVDADQSPWARQTETGEPLLGNAKENNAVATVFAAGKYFE